MIKTVFFGLMISLTSFAQLDFDNAGEGSKSFKNTDNGQNSYERINLNVNQIANMQDEINSLKKEVNKLKSSISSLKASLVEKTK